ncbi:hypothetical protein yc1106_08025 [Curvularia clavata]|uniref:Anion exchange family protein n=1 Tax=Curvularia clavata TaxID=95742 RepID=A0A9Q9DWR2_CURCL|nr:hypothetical protein yc1106_08025 [Curvularia clavata]
MISAERLEQLRELIEADFDALPNRQPLLDLPDDSSDSSGGILLEPNVLDMPAYEQHVLEEKTAVQKTASHATATSPVENSDRRSLWVKDTPSSFNPSLDSLRISSPSPVSDAPEPPVTDLQCGHLSAPHHHFTPIQALAKYPYVYCNKSHMQDIASAFFDQGKFWERVWDLYYVWPISAPKPFVFVKESQAQTLLNEINNRLNLSLRITDHQREEGLVTRFPDHPRCLPRYLGRSRSRQDFDEMTASAPGEAFRTVGEPSHPDIEPDMLETFEQLMSTIAETQRGKGKAKAKRQQERLEKNKAMADQFKRAQRHLGLRETVPGHLPAQSRPSPAIDTSVPVPFAFDQDVVFVCVDVESYEGDHHKITEVGIATLDTRDLQGIAPGNNGEAWRNMIQARHFRIKEYKHLVNSRYVVGHPDGFMFGKSTFVSLKEAVQYVAACFRTPFGAQGIPTGQIEEQRNIILLGHDTLSDVRYLQQLGYDPIKAENIIAIMDTATLYRVWHRDQQPTKLGNILCEFGITGWKLHNAGNDAVYTLQAMLGICVREATIRGTQGPDELSDGREVEKFPIAQEKAVPQYDGSCDNEVYIGQELCHDQAGPAVSTGGQILSAASENHEQQDCDDLWYKEMEEKKPIKETHTPKQGQTKDFPTLLADALSSANTPNSPPENPFPGPPKFQSHGLAMNDPAPESRSSEMRERPSRDNGAANQGHLSRTQTNASRKPASTKKTAWWKTSLFSGMINDVRRRAPFYWSDWKDAWDYRVVPATVYMYFANILPALAFSLDMFEKTNQSFGVNEVLLASVLASVVFSIAAAQPLVIVGVTGPITVFNYTVYDIMVPRGTNYFAFMCWIGIWSLIFHWILAITNSCNGLRYVTRFSCDIFGFYVAFIYLQKGIQVLTRQWHVSDASAYLSIVIALLVTAVAYICGIIGQSSLLQRHVRKFIEDYGTPLTVVFFTGFVHIGKMSGIELLKLPTSKAFFPTTDRGWFIHFWDISVGDVFLAIPFAILLTILFWFDHNVSSLIAQGTEFPLRKPAGFHWDLFLLGLTTGVAGLLGIPFPNGLIPQAPFHTTSLCVTRTVSDDGSGDSDGEANKGHTRTVVDHVVEQRVSNLAQGLLTLGTMTGPLLIVLHLIPQAVLAGLFFVMGIQALEANGITLKLLFLARDRHLTPKSEPLLRIERRWVIWAFVGLELIGFGATFAITQTIAAIGFPVFILLYIPMRTWLMPRFFSPQELGVLDAPTASPFTMESVGGNHGEVVEREPVLRVENAAVLREGDEAERGESRSSAIGDKDERRGSGGRRRGSFRTREGVEADDIEKS